MQTVDPGILIEVPGLGGPCEFLQDNNNLFKANRTKRRDISGTRHSSRDRFPTWYFPISTSSEGIMPKWNQKVNARADESGDEQDIDLDGGSSPSVLETGDVGEIISSGEEDDQDASDDGDGKSQASHS